MEYAESEFTNLDFMDFWMRSIHAYTAENRSNALDNTMLSPPIFVVGTHRASLGSDPVEQSRMVSFELYHHFPPKLWWYIKEEDGIASFKLICKTIRILYLHMYL